MNTSTAKQERALYRCLANDLRGLSIDPCEELCGFVLRDPATQTAMYTAYTACDGTFSSYAAVGDDTGYDLADERPLATRAPLFTAVAKIKAHHAMLVPDLYRAAMGTDEAYRAGHWN